MTTADDHTGDTQILLLRGINVGGHRVAMADLRAECEAGGCRNVRTYIQSGNIVCNSDLDADTLIDALRRRFEDRFGFPVPTLARSRAELDRVISACPFDPPDDPTRLVVWFAPGPIADDAWDGIDPDAALPERWATVGSEVYLWLPDGQARSPLLDSLGRRAAARTVTARNWRTVLALAALARPGPPPGPPRPP